MSQRVVLRTLLILFLPLALAACGRSPTPEASLTYTATATSASSVLVTFDRTVGSGAEAAGNYRITRASSPIEVHAAVRTGGATVLLAVERLEEGVQYELDVRNVTASGGGALSTSASAFGGTSERAPIVASAIALSTDSVLVTFAMPTSGQPATMSDSALDASYYDIVEEAPSLDETPDLTITGIEFAVDDKGQPDRGRVILSTEQQIDTGYLLRVTNVVTSGGDKLIDPDAASAAFRGIPDDDVVAPSVTAASAISNTTVLVSFSEPVVGADRADRYAIVDDAGNPLAVSEAAYAHPYGTQVVLTTAPQGDERTTYTVTVTGVSDRQGNMIGSPDNSATFSGVFRTGPIGGDVTPPRVANTGSTGNAEVLVTFTEPVDEASAETAAHYRITASLTEGTLQPQANLTVRSASLSTDRTTVTLETMPQSDLLYTLEVTNVKDLAGNQIAPPERLNDPSTLTFYGTPPDGIQRDSDCDGISDVAEQRGWIVTVVDTDGTSRTYEVTSNPGDPTDSCENELNVAAKDTDGDGVDDLNERIYTTDPRNADTDGDGLSDDRELNRIYSDPARQDTDGDGLPDGLEVDFYGTSPLFADTDGDQFPDGDEAVTQNRNPLIADLPEFDMRVVGDVQLGLDVRFAAESADGSRVLETRSSETSLVTDSSRSASSENAHATEWFINAGIKAGVEYSPPVDFTFSGEVSVDGGYKEGTTTSFSSASVQSTQQAQAASRTTEREVEQGETITREVVGASMAVALELVSLNDIAFTVENLEVTAKLVDPRDPTRFVPIATLTSSGSQRINLGPAPDARGPIRFTAADPAPALIEALRENPRNLLFEVANYDIVDEFGRNFTYTFQDVNDRTATMFIDYGGRRPSEVRRVATQSAFDENGRAEGVTLAVVLETILGLEYVEENEDPSLIGCLDGSSTANCSAADRARILNSYATRNGVLHRIRSVVADADSSFAWFVEVEVPPGTVETDTFRDVVTTSGRSFRFLYGQDSDGDGLTVQQEAYYGSIDSPRDVLNNACFGDPTQTNCDGSDGIPDSQDTDRDGIRDDEEIFGQAAGGGYEPWLVVVRGEDAVPTSSSPARYDTDGDGMTDCQEFGRCPMFVYIYDSDATATPSTLQNAGNFDPESGRVVGLYRDASGRPSRISTDPAWTIDLSDLSGERLTDPSRFDSDRDGLGDAAEIVGVRYRQLDAQPGDPPFQLYPGWGSDRFSDLTHIATDPLNRDSDFDLLNDGAEVQIGIDPTNPDSTGDAALDDDGDGLRNIEEAFGWVVIHRNASGAWVDAAGNPLYVNTAGRLLDTNDVAIPTDALGNPVSTVDVRLADGTTAPARVPSDPNRADADGDGLDDGEERDLFSHPGRFDTDGDGLGDGEEAHGVDFPSDGVDPVRFTNPLAYDSDGDGSSDGEEVLRSWTVAVRGETPYSVFSDPLIDDEDLDGLSDAVERTQGTDPDDADTDSDGVLDANDINYTVAGSGEILVRSPLVPDQVVEFRYANATVLDSCYLIGGEASLEGWQLGSSGTFFSLWAPALHYSRFGGNPDGYLWVRATNWVASGSAFIYLLAPADFRGDKSAYSGGTFSFDLREYLLSGDQTRFDPNLQISGPGGTIYRDSQVHTSTSWSTVSVPLSVAGGWLWNVPDGDAATQAQIDAVLANVSNIVIYGNYETPQNFLYSLFAGLGFDNPTMAAAGQDTLVNTFDRGALVAGNYRGKLNLEAPNGAGGLGIEEGVVDLRIDLSGVSSGATVPLTSGIHTFVLGRDESLRAFSTTILEESEAYTLGLDPNAVADYGNFTQRYSYPVVGGSDSMILRGQLPDAESGTCELALSWTWRTLE